MSEALKRRLRVGRFTGPEEEAMLGLRVAAGQARDHVERVCARFGVTGVQYNVLRILKGGPPEGYPRGEIAERLIERAPDVTRLVDRLERAGLVERRRSETDRRLSLTRITPKGAALVGEMRPEIDQANRELGARLGPKACRELARLCEPLYAADVE